MRHAIASAACAAAALYASAALAQEDPARLLSDMSKAARSTNYQGVVVYRSGDVLETLRVTHRYHEGRERERLVSMTGDAREIYREGDKVTCILPRERKITVDRRGPERGLFPSLPAEKLASLREHYEFQSLGSGRVAGRLCHGVRVVPRDQYRYGYEFWIDESSRVPLRLSVLDASGGTLELLMFTEIGFPDRIPDSAFESELDTTGYRRVTQSVSSGGDADASPLAVSSLPPGFRLIMRDVLRRSGNHTVEHLLFSDGLSAVSIYSADRPPVQKLFQGVSHMGAMHAFGRVVGERHVTVVGEVPKVTVEMIGRGLQPAGEPEP